MDDAVYVDTRTLYRRGIIMNLTNPKILIFFLSYFPQFIDPSYSDPTQQLILLGVIFLIAALSVFSFISLSAGSIGETLLKSDELKLWIDWMSATIFIALALHLLLS